MSKRKILGDYQTPVQLARNVISRLFGEGRHWERILEPTCGQGNFIRACIEQAWGVHEIIGVEVQRSYVEKSRSIRSGSVRVSIYQQDFFEFDLATSLLWSKSSPLLVVGNPPWITNSEQGRLNGKNLPKKSNFLELSGLDAITGKSNFDIAEAVWLKLISEFAHDTVTIALLCKTSVARKVAQFLRDNELPANGMSLYRIDSERWFNVAVDAGLFVLELNQGDTSYNVDEYNNLIDARHTRTIGFYGKNMVADLDSYREVAHLEGSSQLTWRQGVKHDAAKIMELQNTGGVFTNGYGDCVDIETDHLYPLVKSSDVKSINSEFEPRRYVIVTQKKVGQKTSHLCDHAPKLWKYLSQHANHLDARKSIIYKNAPRFSMFGIGTYSFAPYKVVVSGFYLPAKFVAISKYDGKIMLTDDTCYFLSFDEEWKSLLICAILNHPDVSRFLGSVTFPDSKRPVTKRILERINLNAVIERLDLRGIEYRRMDSGLAAESVEKYNDHSQLRLL